MKLPENFFLNLLKSVAKPIEIWVCLIVVCIIFVAVPEEFLNEIGLAFIMSDHKWIVWTILIFSGTIIAIKATIWGTKGIRNWLGRRRLTIKHLTSSDVAIIFLFATIERAAVRLKNNRPEVLSLVKRGYLKENWYGFGLIGDKYSSYSLTPEAERLIRKGKFEELFDKLDQNLTLEFINEIAEDTFRPHVSKDLFKK